MQYSKLYNIRLVTRISLAEILKFVGTISKQGGMRVIVIPKEFHKQTKLHEGKQIKILLEEI